MRRFALVACSALAALALSACGKKQEEVPEATNNLVEPPADIQVMNDAPPAPVENTPEPVAPPVIGEDQQTLDDADATGMTARLPAGDDEPVDESANHSGHE